MEVRYFKKSSIVIVLFLLISPVFSQQKEFTGNPDTGFEQAREMAFNNQRKEAQELLKLIIAKYPNYLDLRSFLANTYSWDGKYKMARILCDYILKTIPNHADTRLLKGRTLSWDGNYELAEKEFLNTLKREPFYDDPYVALLDLYWWSNQDEKGVVIAKKALRNKIENPLLSFKLAKAYKRLKQNSFSVKVMDSLLNIYPKNKEYLEFKKSLK